MASLHQRCKRRWKGKKWLDTPFSAAYRNRLAWAHFMASASAAAICSAGMSQVAAIRSSTLPKHKKALGTVQVVMATATASTQAYTGMVGLIMGENKDDLADMKSNKATPHQSQ